MSRTKTKAAAALVVLSLVLIGAGAYQLGLHRGHHGVYRTQAILAFGHYKTYGIIVGLPENKCYDAALAEAKVLRDGQASLFANNLQRTGNDPGVMAYVGRRDPELLKSALSGHIPEPGSIETICRPAP